jgi:CRP/FNR family cyclic AMP-dependent transcriptional regulator
MKIDKSMYEKYLRECRAEELIFQEGDPGKEMYIIVEGAVEIRKRTSGSTTKTLIELKKGDIFGEMSIIEDKPRSANAVAIMPTKLLCINEDLFESILHKNNDFALKIIKMLAERLRKTNAIIKNIMSTNKQNQILGGLYQYAPEHGTSTFKGYRVNIEQFKEWTREHLGIPVEETNALIESMLKRKILKASALGKQEIIINKMSRSILRGILSDKESQPSAAKVTTDYSPHGDKKNI